MPPKPVKPPFRPPPILGRPPKAGKELESSAGAATLPTGSVIALLAPLFIAEVTGFESPIASLLAYLRI